MPTVGLNACGNQNGVAHPVQQFFVRRADGGQRAAQPRFPLRRKVVGAEPHPPLHDVECAEAVGVRLLDQPSFVEALQDVGPRGVGGEGGFQEGFPFALRKVGGNVDAPPAPGQFGKAADFQDESPLFL